MLDAFIIEELKQQERDREDDRPQPQLDDERLPVVPEPSKNENDLGKSERGVVIIDYTTAIGYDVTAVLFRSGYGR